MTLRNHLIYADDVISTHTLRKEGDLIGIAVSRKLNSFQPTPSARRVTLYVSDGDYCSGYISTHTLRKEGDERGRTTPSETRIISTHTLRKEGDVAMQAFTRTKPEFQPTPSARRVTRQAKPKPFDVTISTHTLRKEGD